MRRGSGRRAAEPDQGHLTTGRQREGSRAGDRSELPRRPASGFADRALSFGRKSGGRPTKVWRENKTYLTKASAWAIGEPLSPAEIASKYSIRVLDWTCLAPDGEPPCSRASGSREKIATFGAAPPNIAPNPVTARWQGIVCVSGQPQSKALDLLQSEVDLQKICLTSGLQFQGLTLEAAPRSS